MTLQTDNSVNAGILNDSDVLAKDHCNLCLKETRAVVACKHCLNKMCQLHCDAHLVTKTTATHELVSLDEIDSDTLFAIENNHPYVEFETTCAEHQNEILNLFCSLCDSLCCVKCESKVHFHHDVKLFQDVRNSLIEDFKTHQLVRAGSKLNALLDIQKEIKVWEEQLIQSEQTLLARLTSEIDIPVKELLNSVEALKFRSTINNMILDKKRNKVESRIKDLEHLNTEFQNIVESVNPFEFIQKRRDLSEVLRNAVVDDIYYDPSAIHPSVKEIKKSNEIVLVKDYPTYIPKALNSFKKVGDSIQFEINTNVLWFLVPAKEYVFEDIQVYIIAGWNIASLIVEESEDKKTFMIYPGKADRFKLLLKGGSTDLKYSLNGKSFKLRVPYHWTQK